MTRPRSAPALSRRLTLETLGARIAAGSLTGLAWLVGDAAQSAPLSDSMGVIYANNSLGNDSGVGGEGFRL